MTSQSPSRVRPQQACISDSLSLSTLFSLYLPKWSSPVAEEEALSLCLASGQVPSLSIAGLLKCPETSRIFFATESNLSSAVTNDETGAVTALKFRSPWSSEGSGTFAPLVTWLVPPSLEPAADTWLNQIHKGASAVARRAPSIASSPLTTASQGPGSPLGTVSGLTSGTLLHAQPTGDFLALEMAANVQFAKYARAHLCPILQQDHPTTSESATSLSTNSALQTSVFITPTLGDTFFFDVWLRRGPPEEHMLFPTVSINDDDAAANQRATEIINFPVRSSIGNHVQQDYCWLSHHRISVRETTYSAYYSLRGEVVARLPLAFPHEEEIEKGENKKEEENEASASPKKAHHPTGLFQFLQRAALENTVEHTSGAADHVGRIGALVAQAEAGWYTAVSGMGLARAGAVVQCKVRSAPTSLPLISSGSRCYVGAASTTQDTTSDHETVQGSPSLPVAVAKTSGDSIEADAETKQPAATNEASALSTANIHRISLNELRSKAQRYLAKKTEADVVLEDVGRYTEAPPPKGSYK